MGRAVKRGWERGGGGAEEPPITAIAHGAPISLFADRTWGGLSIGFQDLCRARITAHNEEEAIYPCNDPSHVQNTLGANS